MRSFILIFLALTGISFLGINNSTDGDTAYLSPSAMYCNHDHGKAFVSLSTAAKIAVVDIKKGKLNRYIDLNFDPGGIVLSNDSKTLIVADKKPEGSVHFISLKTNKTEKIIRTGHSPDALAITPDGELLFAANRFSNTISVIDLQSFKLIKNIPVEREPVTISISPDGKTVAVANHISNMASTDSYISAKVSLIDRQSLQIIKQIGLAGGSQSIQGLAFSKEGKYLYASHILSRNNQPTSQIEHGWINSNAVSIIDVDEKEYVSSVLLDNFNKGAANPGNMVVSEDGANLFILLTGVHEICKIDLPGLHAKLNRVSDDQLEGISNDLSFLRGLKQRISLKGKSPRHIALYRNKLLVSSYFSTDLEVFNQSGKSYSSNLISLGKEPQPDVERQGEQLFSDADLCFQKWQSCISCHPDARSDGLNWDLLNDGAGNPKNAKSMLYTHFTPPVMITGIRDKAETAVRSGMKYIQFTQYEETDAQAIDAYLKSLQAVPSPYLVNGKLSKTAKRGKKIYEKAGCGKCHSGEYHTDGLKYNVGTGTGADENTDFDVPTLSEVWRTAPYLYDGRAKTMKEVFTKFNPDDAHGVTSNLSDKEMGCLVEYINSL